MSVQGKIGQGFDQDEMLDRLREALMQNGEVFEFRPALDGSCQIKAAPNNNIHGIKATVTPHMRGDNVSVQIEGKLKRMRWFWWLVHVFFFLVIWPYGIVTYMKIFKSRRIAKDYGEDLIRRMRAMS